MFIVHTYIKTGLVSWKSVAFGEPQSVLSL